MHNINYPQQYPPQYYCSASWQRPTGSREDDEALQLPRRQWQLSKTLPNRILTFPGNISCLRPRASDQGDAIRQTIPSTPYCCKLLFPTVVHSYRLFGWQEMILSDFHPSCWNAQWDLRVWKAVCCLVTDDRRFMEHWMALKRWAYELPHDVEGHELGKSGVIRYVSCVYCINYLSASNHTVAHQALPSAKEKVTSPGALPLDQGGQESVCNHISFASAIC